MKISANGNVYVCHEIVSVEVPTCYAASYMSGLLSEGLDSIVPCFVVGVHFHTDTVTIDYTFADSVEE